MALDNLNPSSRYSLYEFDEIIMRVVNKLSKKVQNRNSEVNR